MNLYFCMHSHATFNHTAVTCHHLFVSSSLSYGVLPRPTNHSRRICSRLELLRFHAAPHLISARSINFLHPVFFFPTTVPTKFEVSRHFYPQGMSNSVSESLLYNPQNCSTLLDFFHTSPFLLYIYLIHSIHV